MTEKTNGGELNALRNSIEAIDGEMLRLFRKRLHIAESIGQYKRICSMPITDDEREREQNKKLEAETDPAFLPRARELMRFLIEQSKSVQRKGLNIYLIGMPDCGKTRIGKRLAKRLEMPLADTDKLVMQHMNMSIDEIFSEFGEERFRAVESLMLIRTVKEGGCIVATGGGLPLRNDNAELMKFSGVTVFLDRRLEALYGQNTKNRPLLLMGEGDVNANIQRLYYERRPQYAALADIIADPDSEGAVETIAERALELLKES